MWRMSRSRLEGGPLDPGGWIVELGGGRQVGRRAPDAPQRLDAAGFDDRVAEPLALLVLAQLEVEPEQLLEQALGRRAAAPAAIHRGAQVGVAGDERLAERVHHVLGVALDDG